MKKNMKSFDRRIDYPLLLPVFLLLVIGMISIYIAVSHDYPKSLSSHMLQQGAWIFVGILIAFIVMHFNSRFLWLMTPWLYLLGLGLMVLPLFMVDQSVYEATGARNWVSLNGHTLFQPSELMKISYILLMARVVTTYQGNLRKRYLSNDVALIGFLTLVTVPVMILLKFQNDFGTFLVFLAIFAGIVFVSGVSWKIILPILLVTIVVAGGTLLLTTVDWGRDFLQSVGVSRYQIHRIDAWLDPFGSTRTSNTYQQTQGLISIGIGGLTGYGFDVATLKVPVRESDMIYTVIGENFGFIGGVILLTIYYFLIYRMIRSTNKSNNQFYIYISTGIIMMILFHVFENIGAAIGVLPLTGIPLPFISQGGSSIISNLIGVGLVLSMKYNQVGVAEHVEDLSYHSDGSVKYRRSTRAK